MWTLYAQCMCSMYVPKQVFACVRVRACVRACTCSNVHVHAWRCHSLFTAFCHKFTKTFLLCLKHWSVHVISYRSSSLSWPVWRAVFFNFFHFILSPSFTLLVELKAMYSFCCQYNIAFTEFSHHIKMWGFCSFIFLCPSHCCYCMLFSEEYFLQCHLH